MAKLDSETVRIGNLFAQGFFFSIPNYQRPFSWDKDQLADLVEDLMEAKRENDYFLGTLVLHETSDGTFDVVDGQQRLTALSILLAVLRDQLDSDSAEVQDMLVQQERKFLEIPFRPRIFVRDSGPYNKIVTSEGGTISLEPDPPLLTSADQRYRAAVKIFRDALSDKSQDYLHGLVAFIVQHVVVIYLAANSFDDAFRLFTVVNDRGKQLRRIDVLKAVNLSPEVIAEPALREEYARKWEGFEEALGEGDFESLFAALRLVYVQDKPEGDLLHEFEKRVYASKARPSPGTGFIDELGEFVDLWDAIFISRDYLVGEVDHARFKTLMHAMVSEFRASEWKACVLAYARKFATESFVDFILAIERLFVDQWVRGVRKDERYSSYTAILKAIEMASKPNVVVASIDVSLDAVQNACRSANFYGAGFSKYLLVRSEIQASELSAPREFNPRSVEHVLPQTPKVGSQWLSDFTAEQARELVHTAGNLVLLSKGKNSSAQNKEFSDKKSTYLAPRVSDFPRSLETLAYVEWTPAVIVERTEKFAQGALGPL